MTAIESLKLLHLANFNSTNIGNGALANGLERILEEDLKCHINWQRLPWDDYTFKKVDFDMEFIRLINNSDGLIVGGAVTFNGRDYNDRTGTRFELPFELWDLIEKPVIFYGLSYRNWPEQKYHHKDKLVKMVKKAISKKNMLFSVRNDGTKQWLQSITGIDSNFIYEVPDSAVFVKANSGVYPEVMEGVKNILISFNDEDQKERFDGISSYNRTKLIKAVAEVVERLAGQFQLNIILCPHYFDDYKMISDFIDTIQPKLAHQNIITSGLCRVKDTGYFYGRYLHMDLSISMRVHSMSPCVGLGVPMLALTSQKRMTSFINRIDICSQAIDVRSENLSEKIYEKAVFTLNNPELVRDSFARATSQLREEAQSFNKLVAKILGIA